MAEYSVTLVVITLGVVMAFSLFSDSIIALVERAIGLLARFA